LFSGRQRGHSFAHQRTKPKQTSPVLQRAQPQTPSAHRKAQAGQTGTQEPQRRIDGEIRKTKIKRWNEGNETKWQKRKGKSEMVETTQDAWKE
jgi:hypothetical protein